jgi:hypothetical protein
VKVELYAIEESRYVPIYEQVLLKGDFIKRLLRAFLVLLALSGSLFADILSDYISWVRPSHVRYIFVSTNGGVDYNASEGLGYSSSNGINYTSQSVGNYAAYVGIYVRVYVQPGGLPSVGYAHLYDYSTDSEIVFTNNGSSIAYTYPASYANAVWGRINDTVGSTDDGVGPYWDWFIAMPYLGQSDRVVKVDSCFVYQSNTYCKTARVTINGL